MTIDTGWIALAALALFVAWLGWTVLRTRRRGPEVPPNDAAAPAPEAVVAPVEVPVAREETSVEAPRAQVPTSEVPTSDVPTRGVEPIPQAAARVEPRPVSPAQPPAVAAVTEPITDIPRVVRPPPPRFERVLGIEAGETQAWSAAVPTPLSAAQAGAVAAACAPADDAARRAPDDAFAVLALAFPAGSILRIARGDADMLKSLSTDNETATLRALAWLDSKGASTLASTLLAALASARHLDELSGEVQEIKAAFNTLPPKLAALADGRLKSLVQELSRFMREARDNYAASIARPAFRERVDDACARMLALWHEIAGQLDASRQHLGADATAPRFGEVQIERALASLRNLHDERRLQQFAARVLAALHVLRVSLGGTSSAHAGVHPLQSASAALRAGGDEDAALAARLRLCEQSAQGDPYVGRSEFEASRAAMRKVLDKLDEPVAAAGEGAARLGTAQAAAAEGFPDASGGDDRWLIRVDAAGGAAEVRRASVVRLH